MVFAVCPDCSLFASWRGLGDNAAAARPGHAFGINIGP